MDFKEFSEGNQNVKATVKTDSYSWGKMKTVHHGSSFSIPLHPEHHEAIAKLKDQQEHKFKDETGRHWTAKRDGGDVHFQGANGGNKTKVAHSTMKEEVEQIQEREDDEYHTPTKHHVQVTISKGNGPKEYRKATITAKEPDHAVNAALKHYKGQGYTVHDHKYLGEDVNLDEKISVASGKPPRDSGRFTPNNQMRVDTTPSGGRIHTGTVYTGRDKPKPKPEAEPAKPTKKPSVLDRLRSSMKEEVDLLDEESHLSMAKNAKSEEEFHSHMLNHHMELMHAHKTLDDDYASEHHADKAKHHADKLSRLGDKVKFDEGMEESHAPVAPVPDKKYIKGTPEHKAYKASKKPINGMPTNNVKEETMPQSFKGFLTSLTELTDKQKKHIDKNKNGKIDGHDFKLLRKEDSKCCESCGMEEAKCECMTEETHQSKTTMKHIPNASPALKKAAKDIKPGVAGYRDRIDMLKAGGVKEEADQIEERNKENATKRKMMDASRGAKFKLNNPVPDAEPEHKTAQAHNKAIGRALRNETKEEDPPFDGPYKKVTGDGSVKDKSGAVHTPMSRARDLARKAMQKKMKEDFNLEITEEQAAELCDLAVIDEKMDMSKADMGDVIKDFQKSDAPQFAGKSKEKRREMAIAAKMQSEETKGEDTVKSYKDFVTEIKMADLPSRTVKGTSYGAQYHDPEGEDDADDKKPKKASDAPKRGRGRPAGSKSGAKQQGSEKSSNYGGIDRTTYALHLPRK
jgi:hypothetical protein